VAFFAFSYFILDGLLIAAAFIRVHAPTKRASFLFVGIVGSASRSAITYVNLIADRRCASWEHSSDERNHERNAGYAAVCSRFAFLIEAFFTVDL
jgi:hypothetical protein